MPKSSKETRLNPKGGRRHPRKATDGYLGAGKVDKSDQLQAREYSLSAYTRRVLEISREYWAQAPNTAQSANHQLTIDLLRVKRESPEWELPHQDGWRQTSMPSSVTYTDFPGSPPAHVSSNPNPGPEDELETSYSTALLDQTTGMQGNLDDSNLSKPRITDELITALTQPYLLYLQFPAQSETDCK